MTILQDVGKTITSQIGRFPMETDLRTSYIQVVVRMETHTMTQKAPSLRSKG